MMPAFALALVMATATASAPTAPTTPGPESWLLYLIGSGGLVVIFGALFKTIQDLVKGRAQDKEARTAGAVTQRDTAWRERDDERRARIHSDRVATVEAHNTRKALDYAAVLRRLLVRLGMPDNEIPPEPAMIDTSLIPYPDDPDESPGHRR